MENKKLHLEMIQAIINRMANNSFLLKGWCILIISALFTVVFSNNLKSIWVVIIPIISLWYLDGYFLRQERLYRMLFDSVRRLKENEIDFSMNTTVFKNPETSLFPVIFSKTLVVFYGSLLFITIISTFVKFE